MTFAPKLSVWQQLAKIAAGPEPGRQNSRAWPRDSALALSNRNQPPAPLRKPTNWVCEKFPGLELPLSGNFNPSTTTRY